MKNNYRVYDDYMILEVVYKDKTINCLIDQDDFEEISKYKWWVKSQKGEVTYCYTQVNGKNIYMHRMLTNAHKGAYVDHINGNKLDNRKLNLRLVTMAQNSQNQGLNSRNKFGQRGVSFDAYNNKYRVVIAVEGKYIHIGRYDDFEEAKQVAQDAIRKYMPFCERM